MLRDARPRIPESIRFLVVGGATAAMAWSIRFLFSLAAPYWLAVLLATATSVVLSFLPYRALVFSPSSRPVWRQFCDFVAVNAVTSVAVIGIAVALQSALSIMPIVPPAAAEAGAHAFAIAVGAALNFLGHRRITFRKEQLATASPGGSM